MTAERDALGAEVVDLRIESLAYGGDGVGRDAAGRVVFVPFTAPGDRVQVRVVERFERHARAAPVALLEPGPGRREPPCPLFGTCGGCQLQHLDPAAQRAAKSAQVREALARIAGIAAPPVEPIAAVGDGFGYRRRVRFRVRTVEGRAVLGFFEARSHRLVAVEHCALLAPRLGAAHQALRVLLDAPAIAAIAAQAGLSAATLTAVDEGILVALDLREDPAPADHDALAGALLALPECMGGVVGRRPFGRPVGSVRTRGAPLRVGARSFVQVHAEMNDALARALVDALAPRSGMRIADLFAGGGNFSVPLAAQEALVTAVESDADAFEDLAAAAEARGAGLRAVKADARRWLRDAARAGERFDAVVLDPPRPGAKGFAAPVAALEPERVAYVSCDPTTLARDVKDFGAAGYALASARPFDFFPQTYHIETLAILTREAR